MGRKNRRRPITVGFVALGCPKNMVDSEKMLAEIAQSGFLITAEPYEADVVVINTCGFIAPAKAEALEVIGLALDGKKRGVVKKVIVAGCLSQRLGTELFRLADGIDVVVGLGRRDDIARIISEALNCESTLSYLDYCGKSVSDDSARLLITGGHWAYLRISEGCDHRCSFCTIPEIRGTFRSKPQEQILAEATELVRAGVVELNIIAQDTAYYGRDLGIKDGLAGLLEELEKIDGLKWIRVMYLYPAGINERLIEVFAASEKIVHYVDMPIQHINDRILKDMCRPDRAEQICHLIEKLRRAVPDVILRTTLIVGFPGETEGQFGELLEFIKWAQFDALGCFEYYPESGTLAAEMPAQIPESVKQQRLEALMLAQQQIVFAKNKGRVGTELTCLVDSFDDDRVAKGRFYGQAPDIDSACIIRDCSAEPGQFVKVKVVDTKDYDLLVQQFLH